MAKQSSVNLDITNNSDGFSISGGVTGRTFGISGGDVTLVGSGTATLTFPTTSTTIAGLGIDQTFTALNQFNSGISATSGTTFSAATVYITNSTANIDPLFVQHSSTGALKVSTTGQARSGAIKLGNSTTANLNTFINQTDGTLTFYNGFSTTGSNMLNINTTTLNVSPTISGATFSGIIRSTSGISAALGITCGSYMSSEAGYRITSNAINAKTDSYTLQESDNGEIITMNAGTAKTITVPTGLSVGFNCTVIRIGTGAVSFTASGTTINSVSGLLGIASQHGAASLLCYASNTFNLSGNLA